MKKFLLAVVMVAGVLFEAPGHAGRVAAQTQPSWQRFSHEVGRFSVLVPGSPQANAPTTDKAGTYYTFTYGEPGQRAFVIAYNDATYDMTQPQVELDANRDSFTKALKASVVSEHRFTSKQPIGEVPATQFTCQSAEWDCKSRTFITLRRGFQVGVLTRRGSPASVDADRFLDSFQILPPQ